MSGETIAVQYQRRGSAGTLRMAGVVDIFEANALREAAQKAVADGKAQTLSVNFADVERLDLSAAQILMAARRETLAAGRDFATEGATETVTQIMAWVGGTGKPQ